MKFSKSQRNNIIFLVIITLLIIPQTRLPIQMVLNKGLALFGPSIIDSENRKVLDNYNWLLEDLEGKEFDFKSTHNKVVLINFWATWCPPCIAEMPSLEKLHNDYKDKIIFLFVSNEEEEKIPKYSWSIKTPFFSRSEEGPCTVGTIGFMRAIAEALSRFSIEKTEYVNFSSKKEEPE